MNNFFPEDKNYTLEDFLSNYLKKLNESINSLDLNEVKRVVDALMVNIKSGATIYTCGNGGSSSIADHFVCDLVKGASSDNYGIREDAHHALMHILSQYIRLISINDPSEVGKIKF